MRRQLARTVAARRSLCGSARHGTGPAPHHGLRPHQGAERPCLTGGPEHLLCAMLEDDSCTAGLLLASWECPSLRPCRSAASCPGSLSFPRSAAGVPASSMPRAGRAGNKYCRDDHRALDELDPVFCRDAELDRMVEICAAARRTTPVWWGAGCEQDCTLAEGWPSASQRAGAPCLAGARRLLALDMASVQAPSTGAILKSASRTCWRSWCGTAPPSSLWTNSHTIVGAGAAWRNCPLMRASILKPVLARSSHQCRRNREFRTHPEGCRAGAPLWPGAGGRSLLLHRQWTSSTGWPGAVSATTMSPCRLGLAGGGGGCRYGICREGAAYRTRPLMQWTEACAPSPASGPSRAASQCSPREDIAQVVAQASGVPTERVVSRAGAAKN